MDGDVPGLPPLVAEVPAVAVVDDDDQAGRPTMRPPGAHSTITSIPGLVLTPLAAAATPLLDPFARWPKPSVQESSQLGLDPRAREHLVAVVKQAVENVGVKRPRETVEGGSTLRWEDVLVRMLVGREGEQAVKGDAEEGPSERIPLVDLFDTTTLRRLVERNRLIALAERKAAQEPKLDQAKGKGKAKEAKKADAPTTKEAPGQGHEAVSKGPADPAGDATIKADKAKLEEKAAKMLKESERRRLVRDKIRELLKASPSDAQPAWSKPLKLVLHLKRQETRQRLEPREAWFQPGKWDGDDRLFNGASCPRVLVTDDGEDEESGEELCERFGGTITIKGPAREVRRMLRAVELAIFAACNLKLEVHLLRDSSCSRLPPLPPETPLAPGSSIEGRPSPGAPSTSESDAQNSTKPVDDLTAELTPSQSRPPGSTGSGRAKWSRTSMWGLLLGRPHTPKQATSAPEAAPPMAKSSSDEATDPHRHGGTRIIRDKALAFGKRLGTTAFRRRGYAKTDPWETLANGGAEAGSEHMEPASTEPSDEETEDVMPGALEGIGRRRKKAEAMKDALAVRPDALRPTQSDGSMPTIASFGSGSTRSTILTRGTISGVHPRIEEPEPADRFERVIKKMERALLSVSPEVVFPPPHLLVRLRQQEIVDSDDHLHPAHPANAVRPNLDRQRSFATADAEVLTHAFTGSHGLDASSALPYPAASMSRHAGEKKITVDARAGLASLMTNNSSLEGTIRHQSLQVLYERSSLFASPGSPACDPPRWVTLRYYDNMDGKDLHGTIGEVVDGLIDAKDDPCEAPGCGRSSADHVMSLVHNTVKITVAVDRGEMTAPPTDGARDAITMWARCKTCGKASRPMIASDATLLFSFPKLLELILYGDAFVPSPDELCEHGEEHHDALIRVFCKGQTQITLALQNVDLYELRLPTAIDASIGWDGKDAVVGDVRHGDGNGDLDPPVQELRQEIVDFFASLKRRLDVLEEAFDRFESGAQGPPSEASSRASSISEHSSASEEKATSNAVISRGRSKTIKASLVDHQALLGVIRSSFQANETELLGSVSTVTSRTLNNLRKPFVDRIVADKARLLAWEKKHTAVLGAEERKKLGAAHLVEPAYAAPGVHALPADNSVLIRENELSSIIAFTLSSSDFLRQLASNRAMNAGGTQRRAPQTLAPPGLDPHQARRDASVPSSLFPQSPELPDVPSRRTSPVGSPRIKSGGTFRNIVADPDDDEAVFGEDRTYFAAAKPKKALKHATSILSLRALARQRSFDVSSFRPFGSLHATPAKPPSSVAEATEEVVTEKAGKGGDKGNDEKLLSDLIEGAAESKPNAPAPAAPAPAVAPAPVAALLSRGTMARPSASLDVCSTPHKVVRKMSSLSSHTSTDPRKAPTAAPSPDDTEAEESFEVLNDEDIDHSFSASRHPSSQHSRPGSILSPLHALWGMGSQRIKPGDMTKDLGLDPDSSSPHIKCQFRHGTKEFTCTVWHAEQFAAIRQKCGISDQDFLISSLSRCNTWEAVGGKSKAIFLKTSCDRFVLKQMVSAWNVSEREALLAFAPSYFSYLLNQTNQKPSLLCKIFGFFTVKIKDLAKDENIVKLDLLLLENLFHASFVSRKFDLKGISTRVAKVDPAKSGSGHTGWDADWLEGSLRTLLLIHPHSKSVIASAIENDTAFLEETNTMDYSMLAGIDDHRRELIVGLIDVIGTFNLAKMIESRSKMALKSREQITILPPSDYAARFRRAMETYFVSVPEKWSRPTECPVEDQQWHDDPYLPSVF